MNVYHPHLEFPSNLVPIEINLWWRDNADLFLRCIISPKFHKSWEGSSLSGNLIIYPPMCNIKENILNGRKSKRNVPGMGVRHDEPAPFRWINLPLTSEDINLLEQEEASLEQLAYAYIQLGVRGFGLSIKFDNTREQYICSIYGSDFSNNNQPCGISGAATQLRDALLVSLYRFNNRLQGSFDGKSNTDTTVQSTRFR
jgi:hypothetical protein